MFNNVNTECQSRRERRNRLLRYDTIIISNTQDEASRRLIDDHLRQQIVLKDILLSLQDSDLDNALLFLPVDFAALDLSGGIDGETGGGYPELFCELSGGWLALAYERILWVGGISVKRINCYDVSAKRQFYEMLENKIEERTSELKKMTEEANQAKLKAEDATMAKSQFMANMSHEIRKWG